MFYFLTDPNKIGFVLFLFLVKEMLKTHGLVAEALVFVVLFSAFFLSEFLKFSTEAILIFIFVK